MTLLSLCLAVTSFHPYTPDVFHREAFMDRILRTSATPDVLATLGERLRQYRLQQNRTVGEVATASGVTARTILRAEATGELSLRSLVQILRGLGRLEALDAVLPPPGPSPLALLRTGGDAPQRASKRRKADGT